LIEPGVQVSRSRHADARITRYRATLDPGGDPALIAEWISETTAIKKAAQARLGLTEARPRRG
jgi:hypothetical protein